MLGSGGFYFAKGGLDVARIRALYNACGSSSLAELTRSTEPGPAPRAYPCRTYGSAFGPRRARRHHFPRHLGTLGIRNLWGGDKEAAAAE